MPSEKDSSRVPPSIRLQIFYRDGFKCRCWNCLDGPQDETILVVHHKDEDPKNNHFSNLVTMKRSCHTAFHRRLVKAKRLYAQYEREMDFKYPKKVQALLHEFHV